MLKCLGQLQKRRAAVAGEFYNLVEYRSQGANRDQILLGRSFPNRRRVNFAGVIQRVHGAVGAVAGRDNVQTSFYMLVVHLADVIKFLARFPDYLVHNDSQTT